MREDCVNMIKDVVMNSKIDIASIDEKVLAILLTNNLDNNELKAKGLLNIIPEKLKNKKI